MYVWKQLEAVFDSTFSHDPEWDGEFSCSGNPSLSAATQSYLAAGRAPNSKTKYYLKRKPGTRTKSTIWQVTRKAKVSDFENRIACQIDDLRCSVRRTFKPDLDWIARNNPRLATEVEMKMVAVDYAYAGLAASLGVGLRNAA